jgi:hypothetical protein
MLKPKKIAIGKDTRHQDQSLTPVSFVIAIIKLRAPKIKNPADWMAFSLATCVRTSPRIL